MMYVEIFTVFLSAAILIQVCSAQDERCRPEPGGAICSGKGQCDGEGYCVCQSQHYGQYCECNNDACPRYQGLVCGGPNRGLCSCRSCACNVGYTGEDCGCPTSADTCMARNGQICNGKGRCVCGKCECEGQLYIGPTCEDCPTCQSASPAVTEKCRKLQNRCTKKLRQCGWELSLNNLED